MNENGDLFADIYAVVLLLGWRNFLNQKKFNTGVTHLDKDKQIAIAQSQISFLQDVRAKNRSSYTFRSSTTGCRDKIKTQAQIKKLRQKEIFNTEKLKYTNDVQRYMVQRNENEMHIRQKRLSRTFGLISRKFCGKGVLNSHDNQKEDHQTATLPLKRRMVKLLPS